MRRIREFSPLPRERDPFALAAAVFGEIRGNRWLIWQLFRRDLLGRHKMFVLGLAWSLAAPLAGVLTLTLLNRSGIFRAGETRAPYPLFALAGLLAWQYFAGGLVAATNALVEAGPVISRVNVSRKAFIFASQGNVLLTAAIQCAALLLLALHYGVPAWWQLAVFPFLLLPLAFLALGLGFVFSLIQAVIHDVGQMLSLSLGFVLLLTPVFYLPPSRGSVALLSRFNPLYYLICFPRELMLWRGSALLGGYLLSCAFSLGLLAAGITIFHLAERKVIERL